MSRRFVLWSCNFRFRFGLTLLYNKFINSPFKIDLTWMTNVVGLSKLVNQTNKGNTLNFVILNQLVLSFPTQKSQMFNFSPTLLFNSILDGLFWIINAHTNNSNLIFPPFIILHKHLLIVSHRPLTRTTPSSPNIN